MNRALFILLFITVAEAKVSLTNSDIFDEFDFAFQSIPLLRCRDWCQIYASISRNFTELSNSLVIVNDLRPNENLTSSCTKKSVYDDTACSVAQIAALFESSGSSVKVSRILPPGSYSVQNRDPYLKTEPLVLYVLPLFSPIEDIPALRRLQPVYEVRADDHAPQSIKDRAITATFMSAEPFTFNSVQSENDYPISIYASGFDGVDQSFDNCHPLHKSKSSTINYPVAIRSPISTLHFGWNRNFTLAIVRGVESSVALGDSYSTTATSYGYIGCNNPKAYRSSLYPYSASLNYHSDRPQQLQQLISYLNVQEEKPLNVTFSSGEFIKLTGSSKDPIFHDINMKVTWIQYDWFNDGANSFAVEMITEESQQPISTTTTPSHSTQTLSTLTMTKQSTHPTADPATESPANNLSSPTSTAPHATTSVDSNTSIETTTKGSSMITASLPLVLIIFSKK